MDRRPISAPLRRLLANPAANGMQLAQRGLVAADWRKALVKVTADQLVVVDGSAFELRPGGRFAYVGAR